MSLAVGEQGGKAGPLGHRIGAGYGGIIKAGGDDMPPCGVDLDRFGLATLAPLEGHPIRVGQSFLESSPKKLKLSANILYLRAKFELPLEVAYRFQA